MVCGRYKLCPSEVSEYQNMHHKLVTENWYWFLARLTCNLVPNVSRTR